MPASVHVHSRRASRRSHPRRAPPAADDLASARRSRPRAVDRADHRAVRSTMPGVVSRRRGSLRAGVGRSTASGIHVFRRRRRTPMATLRVTTTRTRSGCSRRTPHPCPTRSRGSSPRSSSSPSVAVVGPKLVRCRRPRPRSSRSASRMTCVRPRPSASPTAELDQGQHDATSTTSSARTSAVDPRAQDGCLDRAGRCSIARSRRCGRGPRPRCAGSTCPARGWLLVLRRRFVAVSGDGVAGLPLAD